MIGLAAVVLCLAAGAQAQLNPLGRFGKCIDVPTESVTDKQIKGLWYLQWRNDNPDHYVHTCQAQYEQKVGKYLTSLLYFYNKGKMVNKPQNIQYGNVKPGKYYRKIGVDGRTVVIHANILDFNKAKGYRVVYFCADDENANPDIFNVAIQTRDMEPSNLEEVLELATDKVRSIDSRLDVDLMKTTQDSGSCKPLNVKG